MIEVLLFTITLTQILVTLLLVFKTPLRNLILLGLDGLKHGKGPVMVDTLACTILVLLIPTLYSITKTKHTDQLLFAHHLLKATLMGAIFLLSVMIDRLHYYIKELSISRKNVEAATRQSETEAFEDVKDVVSNQVKALKEEKVKLRRKLEQLKSDFEAKRKQVNTAQVNAIALRKQSDGSCVEYDRLLKENEKLRIRLQMLDWRVSYSAGKKNT